MISGVRVDILERQPRSSEEATIAITKDTQTSPTCLLSLQECLMQTLEISWKTDKQKLRNILSVLNKLILATSHYLVGFLSVSYTLSQEEMQEIADEIFHA